MSWHGVFIVDVDLGAVTPCGLADRYQSFGEDSPEEGGTVFLRNVDV
jgi:hypothetical protein